MPGLTVLHAVFCLCHVVYTQQQCVVTGGPSVRWTAANTVQPQSFAITTTNDARGLNNTWTLSELCQQNVQIRGDNSNAVLYSQPPNTCM